YLHLGYIAGFLLRPLDAIQVFNPYWTAWYFRPLQNLWFLFCRFLFGLNPFAYYYLQGLWHVLAGMALFTLARRLGLPQWAAVVVLALFMINSHHQDVIAWISSVSILMATAFSLLAIVCYLNYLRRRKPRSWLLGAALFAVLAMLSHEEGLLLPAILLVVRLAWGRRTRPERLELLAGGAILLLTAALGVIQFVRPNSTIALQGQSPAQWLASLYPQNVASYVVVVLSRWLLLNKSAPGVRLTLAVMQRPALILLIAAGVAGIFSFAIWRGNNIIRLSAFWLLLHLGFLYLAVWRQKPEFFAGRHLYASWAIVALALGSVLASRSTSWEAVHWRRTLLALLALALGLNILLIGSDQGAWEKHALEVAAAERQMKMLIPQVTPATRVFARRFVITPSFVPYAAAVWYAEPGISGGTLQRLQGETRITRETYLLDYADGRLFNALPGLQQFSESTILWQSPRATVPPSSIGEKAASYQLEQIAGPQEDRRLAVQVAPPPEGWLSLQYDVGEGTPTHLSTAVLGAEGLTFHIRLLGKDGEEIASVTEAIDDASAGIWQQMLVPLEWQGPRAAKFSLEVRGPADATGYWSVPLLVEESGGHS
ncbi:MAG TPA: hypothetical protein VE553_00325, partial [Candidatus Binatia bacterium]|nr:hypothetical protein [Candidatus Binatia bacterium]